MYFKIPCATQVFLNLLVLSSVSSTTAVSFLMSQSVQCCVYAFLCLSYCYKGVITLHCHLCTIHALLPQLHCAQIHTDKRVFTLSLALVSIDVCVYVGIQMNDHLLV